MLRRWNKLAAIAAACALAAAAVGCGSGDDDGGGGGSAPTTASGLTESARAAIEAAYRGAYAQPPSDSPAPRPDQNIWFIPVASSLVERGALDDAAAALGWRVTQFDGRFSPDTVVSGLRQAIADKADGILLYVIDCATAKSALQQVDRAGIPVVAVESQDCDDVRAGEPSLYDAVVSYNDPASPGRSLTYPEWIRGQYGYMQGLGVIAGTNGRAKLVNAKQTDLDATLAISDGMLQALEDHCPDCEVVETVEFVGADYGAALQQKIAQALVRNPDANAVVGPGDFPFDHIAPAIQASGRNDEIWGQAGEGLAPMVDRIRENKGADAGVGNSTPWGLWAGLDAINRLLNGEEPPPGGFPSGIGTQLYDRERNTPPSGTRWQPSLDFKQAYLDAWGRQ